MKIRYNINMKLEKILVVLGPPGSGKGTQSKLLVQKLGYAFFTMGDSLREAATKDNDLGRKIKVFIDQGIIVTDDLAEQVAVAKWSAITDKPGMLCEGYPRTAGQVAVLDRFMSERGVTDLKVLCIEADKQKLIDRLIKRSRLEGRADDASLQAIEKRFDEFDQKTAKVIEYYRGKNLVIDINGDQPIDAVHEEILRKLNLEK